MTVVADFAALVDPELRPAPRDGADSSRREAARALLEMLPTTEMPADVREAWWRLAETLTAGRPHGCAAGHPWSELAWHPDKRLRAGGRWYCRACRREERREKGRAA